MNKLIEENTVMESKRIISFRNVLRFAAVGALAALLVVGFSFAGWFGTGHPPSAVNLLAQSVLAMSTVHTVHINARMRTLPNDNFELIGPDYDFVPIEMWKRFGNPAQWRIEKPGRVAVMDGQSSVLWIKPGQAARGGADPGFVGWLKPLLDTDQLLDRELQRAHQQQSEFSVQESNSELLLTVRVKAQNGLTNDWLKNKFLFTSDHTLVYRFDAGTRRLTGLEILVHGDSGDVVVFEITGILYDLPIDPALFSLVLPADVALSVPTEQMPPVSGGPLVTARDVAVAFFEGCAREDWNRVLQVYPVSSVEPRLKDYLGGIEIISLGAPFEINLHPLGFDVWFVPYQIKLKSGDTKKWYLAVRNDNRAQRWKVDGGF